MIVLDKLHKGRETPLVAERAHLLLVNKILVYDRRGKIVLTIPSNLAIVLLLLTTEYKNEVMAHSE